MARSCSLRILFTFLSFMAGMTSHAWTEKALESSDPFVISPSNLSTDFFRLETKRKWSWVPQSFEWVRVDHRMIVPRARVKIEVPAGSAIRYQGRVMLSKGAAVELLIALSQERGNEIEVDQEVIPIRFQSARGLTPALVVDTSCSGAPLIFSEVKLNHSWAFVFCHALHPRNGKTFTTQSDLQILWEGEDTKLLPRINGTNLASIDGITFGTNLNSDTPVLSFTRGEDSFHLEQKLSAVFHPLSFSIGLGPYVNQQKWLPFATLYAAYYFNEQLKLASFTALPIRSEPQIDSGLYVISEQFRGFDERMVVSLLLGAHALSFESLGTRYLKFSAPQGVELSFRDAFARNQNFLVGAFYYPMINERSYINTWVRYGNFQLFFELNYMQWQEPVTTGTFESRSFGLSVGFPLFKAL